jgi:hypothetical protein
MKLIQERAGSRAKFTGRTRIACSGEACKPGRHIQRILWKVVQKPTPALPSVTFYFCNRDFDIWIEQQWDAFEQFEIERLSDNEGDFEYVNQGRGGVAENAICQVPRPIDSASGD